MKIFVAFGYNDRDRWIKEMVFPIIDSLGCEVLTGELTFGKSIAQDIQDKIEESDFLLAFTTERITEGAATGQASRWVLDEIAAAVGKDKQVIEVRESALKLQDTFLDGHQVIYYYEEERDRCLVEIVKALVEMRKTLQKKPKVKIQLLPKGWAHDDLRPKLDKGGLICTYVVRNGSNDGPEHKVDINPIRGGLFIDMPSLSPEEMIRVTINYGGQKWLSDYESIDAYGIHLNLEAPSLWQRLRGK